MIDEHTVPTVVIDGYLWFVGSLRRTEDDSDVEPAGVPVRWYLVLPTTDVQGVSATSINAFTYNIEQTE